MFVSSRTTLYHSPPATGEAEMQEGKAEVSYLVLSASTNANETRMLMQRGTVSKATQTLLWSHHNTVISVDFTALQAGQQQLEHV